MKKFACTGGSRAGVGMGRLIGCPNLRYFLIVLKTLFFGGYHVTNGATACLCKNMRRDCLNGAFIFVALTKIGYSIAQNKMWERWNVTPQNLIAFVNLKYFRRNLLWTCVREVCSASAHIQKLKIRDVAFFRTHTIIRCMLKRHSPRRFHNTTVCEILEIILP